MKKTAISTTLAIAMGLGIAGQAAAATLTAGSYTMTIRETPELAPGTGIPDPGCVGSVCSNSSFTFGGFPSFTQSNRMTDNGNTVAGAGGIGGDLVAGVIGFDVDAAGVWAITSFSVDSIAGTAAGTFAQYAPDISGMSGSIDAAGNISFTPTGRIANTSAPAILGNPFNTPNYDFGLDGVPSADDIPGAWSSFTTGTLVGPNNAGSITGSPLDAAGHAVLVSTDSYGVGPNWGTFDKGTYYEVWSVDIQAIPVPAAVWLFGSGLLGLVGIARRKKKA